MLAGIETLSSGGCVWGMRACEPKAQSEAYFLFDVLGRAGKVSVSVHLYMPYHDALCGM